MGASVSDSGPHLEDDQEPRTRPSSSDQGGAVSEEPDEKKQTKELLQTLKDLTNKDLYQSALFLREHRDSSQVNQLLTDLIEEIGALKEQPRSKAEDVKAPKVKAFCVVAGRTFGAEGQILQKINADVCEEPEQCDVVLVFCPICTRADADVADAMRRIPAEVGERPVILVKMHHTRDGQHAVPWSERNHDDIALSVSVLYHETERGLLECARNDETMKEIQETMRLCSSKVTSGWFSPWSFMSQMSQLMFCGRKL